jgi:Leucine-rich repeat (LRR) protein
MVANDRPQIARLLPFLRWGLLIALCGGAALFALRWTGLSEAPTVRSWRIPNGSPADASLSDQERDFVQTLAEMPLRLLFGFRFGAPSNHFHCDTLGRVVELRLRSAGVRSLDELPGLKQMSHLWTLDLMGNPLTGDLDFSLFPNLEVLSLSRCGNVRILGLEKLRALKSLTVRFCGIHDPNQLPGLSRTAHLEHLDLGGNPLWPSFDTGLVYTDELVLADTQVREIRHAAGLHSLDLTRSTIRSLGDISTLQELNLSGIDLQQGPALSGAAALATLFLYGATLPAHHRRLHFPQLVSLSLRGTRNVNVSAVAVNRGLYDLRLDDTGIENVTALKDLTSLYFLSLRGTQVTDLSPLRGLPKLVFAWLPSSRIQASYARSIFPRSVVLFDHYHGISGALTPWEKWFLGAALLILVFSPMVLSWRSVLLATGSIFPWQMAALWRAAGIYLVMMYVMSVPLAGIAVYANPARLAMKLTIAWLALHTAVLILSWLMQQSSIPLWILTFRRFSAPFLFLIPFMTMILTIPIRWIVYSGVTAIGLITLIVLAVVLYAGTRVPMKTNNRTSAARPTRLARGQTAFAGDAMRFTYSWCWAIFGEQSMVISRECRSRFSRPLGRLPAQAGCLVRSGSQSLYYQLVTWKDDASPGSHPFEANHSR